MEKNNKFGKFVKEHGKTILIATGIGVAGFVCGHRCGADRYTKKLMEFVGDKENICFDSIDLCGRTLKDTFAESELNKVVELFGYSPDDEVVRMVASIKRKEN